MEPWEVKKKKEFREMILAKPVLMQDWASCFRYITLQYYCLRGDIHYLLHSTKCPNNLYGTT